VPRAVPNGLDKPVSNITEAAPVPDEQRETKPNDGDGKEKKLAATDGTEGVEGYRSPSNAQRETLELSVPENIDDLPDIALASFGPAPETVHGADDRVQITNTADYPWRAHASLLITAADNSQWIGTGWFIGQHTLMTAGHVVYIKNSGVAGRDGYVKSIQVMPGRDGAKLPYGSATSTNFRTVTGWINNGDEEHDYGAIILATDLGATTGWFGFGVYDDATLTASVGNISGYPGDKPSGTQWYASRTIASVAARKVFYDIDTAGGQSGSAVYRIVNGSRFAVAVHAYGGSVTNSGTRIVQPVYDNMVAWRA
jgi:V8-like Glu-specific endopeptidase